MATGQYASVPCILVWMSNNSAGHYKRATTSALQLAIANCGGFVASMLPSTEACIENLYHMLFCGAKMLMMVFSLQRSTIRRVINRISTVDILLFWDCWCLRGLCEIYTTPSRCPSPSSSPTLFEI